MYAVDYYQDDDGEWQTVQVLSRRVLTARKEHKCDGTRSETGRLCRQPIKPGDRYERLFLLWDEDGSTMEIMRHLKTCYHDS